jgi:hypothetical protein
MNEGMLIDSLISEYDSLIVREAPMSKQQHNSRSKVLKTLVKTADWTESGANELLTLVENYGAFMLRNALALAIVLKQEDGILNF